MGEAMISGLLKQNLIAADQIVATEPRAGRREEIEQRYGVRVTDDNWKQRTGRRWRSLLSNRKQFPN
jgi:pyrroline-5-carboxylate reductase